ncbi:MAG TPA: MarR family transcriptional regulator [Curvibacter sp.]|nr:MarR family transcriptional regulator [Curvibacter sp.]
MTSTSSTSRPVRPGAVNPRRPHATATDAVEPAVLALRRFRVIFNAVRTHFQQVEKRTGTGAAQLRALSVLREQPGIRLSELAQAMDVHQSTASNLVKTLLERELIAALQNGTDRRVRHLHLLPAGTRILQRMRGPYIGVLPQALGTLPPQTLLRLNADLDVLIAAMHTDDTAAMTPLANQL